MFHRLSKFQRTVVICVVALWAVYTGMYVSQFTLAVIVNFMHLTRADAVSATSAAELVARGIATGTVLWKLAAVLAEAETHRDMWELLKTRAMLFGLALFATLFLAMDQRVFWWAQQLMGAASDAVQARLHQTSFTALAVNCITLMLFHFKSWKGVAIGLFWLSVATAAGFFGALWLRTML